MRCQNPQMDPRATHAFSCQRRRARSSIPFSTARYWWVHQRGRSSVTLGTTSASNEADPI